MVTDSAGIFIRRSGVMRWQDLIATSRLLTSTPDPNTAPLPDSLRRAVSTAYYAVFHALANSNADCLIGVPTSPLLEHTWQRARRGLDHTPARRNLEQDRHRFSPPVQEFITTFAALQNCGPLLLTLPRPAPNLVLSHPAGGTRFLRRSGTPSRRPCISPVRRNSASPDRDPFMALRNAGAPAS